MVPDLTGRRDRPPLWKRIACALAGGLVGVPVAAIVGIYIYTLFESPHGCGNIGCWDALAGGFVGALVGVIGGPLAALRLLRRVQPPPTA